MAMALILTFLILFGVTAPKPHRTSIRGQQVSTNRFLWPGSKYQLVDTGSIVFNDSLPSGNRYYIRFGSRTFNPKQHKITRQIEEAIPTPDTIVAKIDGSDFYGTDGEMPRTEIDTFVVVINGRSISIPRSKYRDLFNPNVYYKYGSEPCCGVRAHEAKNGQHLIVDMWGSDGAGGYFVAFYFDHNKLLRRSVENGF